MQKLVLSVSIIISLFLNIAIASENDKSFHLDSDEMAAYLKKLDINTSVDEAMLLDKLPAFEIEKSEDTYTFNFENNFNNTYTLHVYNLKGEIVDTRYNITGNKVSTEKGYLPEGEYIYNLQSKNSVYSGLLSF
ncbi:MAG: hypothetical protein EA412_06015 [Chitinophagaceae bacterium]|nr:MAG: hypothetical protein EA412_06015 [Chitinophagaceae bacterium]